MNKFLEGLRPIVPSSFQGINLARNENFLRPNLHGLEIDPRGYPNKEKLIKIIAEKEEVHPDQIVLGNGSTEIINLAIRTFLCIGKIAHMDNLIYKPLEQMVLSTGARIMRASGDVRIIVNPNNPTGCISAFNNYKPYDVVIVDEAYIDYDYESFSFKKYIPIWENLIVTRSLSKLYGLAGLRIGYAITTKEIAEQLKIICDPYNLNSYSIEAASMVLRDYDFKKRSLDANAQSLSTLSEGLRNLGVEVMSTCANFVMVKIENNVPGFSIRDLGFYPELQGCSRISTHHPEIMIRFIIELEKTLGRNT